MPTAGDILLDASGNRLLDTSGNLSLHNGSGGTCGCTCFAGCWPCPTASVPSTLTARMHYKTWLCRRKPYDGGPNALTFVNERNKDVVLTRRAGSPYNVTADSSDIWENLSNPTADIASVYLSFGCNPTQYNHCLNQRFNFFVEGRKVVGATDPYSPTGPMTAVPSNQRETPFGGWFPAITAYNYCTNTPTCQTGGTAENNTICGCNYSHTDPYEYYTFRTLLSLEIL